MRENRAVFEIAEDGLGFDPSPAGRSKGFGHVLVDLLVHQIMGTLKVNCTKGTRCSIELETSTHPAQTDPDRLLEAAPER